MAVATMNRISISLIFLIMISMVLPTSAIMFASGSTDNSEETSDTGSSEDNSDSSSDTGSSVDNGDSPPTDFLPPNVDSTSSDGSTNDNGDSSATSTENNTTLPSESPLGNNTANVQGEDLVSIILTLHNQERAAVGVPPLTWSDSLAAHAQPWADKVYETGDSSHSSGVADFGNYGENMAWGGGPSFATPTWLAQTWADEKSQYVPVLQRPIALVITPRWLTSNQPRLVAGLLVDRPVNMLNMVERMYWFVNTLLLETGIANHHIRIVSFLPM